MRITILKNCLLTFGEPKQHRFTFGHQVELSDDRAKILIDAGYAKKVTLIEKVKEVIAKQITSSDMENKAILSSNSDVENKEEAVAPRARSGRPKKNDEK